MIRLVVSGCCGRMGSRICALAAGDKGFRLEAAFERKDRPEIGKKLGDALSIEGAGLSITSDAEEAIKKGEVLIEFTTPLVTLEHLAIALKHKKAMVIGTTAIDSAGVKKIARAAEKIPVVYSPNMSVGVNLLFRLTGESAAVLKDCSVSMTEAHHKHKKDAPSGTAKALARIIKDASGKEDIPIESIREGEIIGDHTVFFDGEFETLELTHRAKSRDVFASGSLLAAKFASQKKRGLFSMQDVLGIQEQGQ